MEIRNVTTFLTLAELKSFTKTAETLGYSQGAVTVQIKQLETELEVQLFDRFSWGTELTSAGEAFKPYAQRLLNAYEDAKAFGGRSAEPEGTLRIGSTASIANAILPPLLIEFQKMCPKVYVSVLNNDFYEDLIDDLRHNELDFVFITDFRREYRGIAKAVEKHTKIEFICHRDHPLAGKKNVSFRELIKHRLITSDREHGYTAAMEAEMARLGYKLNPILDFGSTAAIIKLLMTNEAISFLPKQLVEDHLKAGRLSIIDCAADWDLQIFNQLYYNDEKWMSPAMYSFIAFMKTRIRET